MVHRAPSFLICLALVGLAACGPAEPEGPRVEGDPVGVVGAHEHGVARLALTVEATDVYLALEAPGDALFGFERAPRTDEERTLITERVAALEAGLASALAMPAELGCRASGPVVVTGVPDTDAPDDGHEHDHDHEEGHDHADDEHDHGEEHDHEDEHDHAEDEHDHEHEDGEEHMEVAAELTLVCDVAPAGYEVQLSLAELLPDAEQVDLTVVTEVGEAAARVPMDATFAF